MDTDIREMMLSRTSRVPPRANYRERG